MLSFLKKLFGGENEPTVATPAAKSDPAPAPAPQSAPEPQPEPMPTSVAESESSVVEQPVVKTEVLASLYERIGGEAAVDAAVDIFYRKVLADDRINKYFEDTDMEAQAQKQKAFLTLAFGGPNDYSGADMREAHANLVQKGLSDEHFDAVMENLAATLTELNVPDELIAEAAAIAESTRTDVLGR